MSHEAAPEEDESEPEVVDPWADLPGDVGDDREKYVHVTLKSGEEIEHGDVYFRYTADEFIIAPTMDFEDTEVNRYKKAETASVEIVQHHPRCFITTAVTQNNPALDLLRGFRDDVLTQSRSGRVLVGIYDRVSPTVAQTLARAPESRLTALIRWFVHRSANLEQHRRTTDRYPRLHTWLIVTLYFIGLTIAITGTMILHLRALTRGQKTV